MDCIRVLHMAANRAGLADEEYRLILRDAAGVRSSKEVRTREQYEAIRRVFRKLGVDIPGWKRKAKTTDRQMAKAYALWCSLHKEGKVADKSWQAMESWIKRQFAGQDILTGAQKSHLIEMLKMWLDRED